MRRLLLLLALIAPACTRHYRIVDVETKKVYYARKAHVHDHGSVIITNAKTGSEVTIRAADVERISEEEFDKALAGE